MIIKTKYFFKLILVPFIIGCGQSSNNADKPNDSTKVSIVKNNDNTKIQKDTSAVVKFIDYNSDGLILPGNYKLYDENIKLVGNLKIKSIKQIKILQQTKNKHPQMTNVAYCDWANYLKIINNEDTIIVFGNNVLETTTYKENLKLKSDTLDLVLADDFSMKAGDDDGLTGCNDFSYMFVNSNNGLFSLIYPQHPDKEMYSDFALLSHDAGVGEEIKDIMINGDTLILKIDATFQEGTGSYILKIFHSSKWTFFTTDRTRKYE